MKYLVSPTTNDGDYCPPATFLAPYTEPMRKKLLLRMKKTEMLQDWDSSLIAVRYWDHLSSIWGIPKDEEDWGLMEKRLDPHMYGRSGILELPEGFIGEISLEGRSVDCKTLHARPDNVRAVARMGEIRIESYSFSRELIESTDP